MRVCFVPLWELEVLPSSREAYSHWRTPCISFWADTIFGLQMTNTLSKPLPPMMMMTRVQGWASSLRLCFVDLDLGFSSLCPRCYAHSVRFPPAQAELGNCTKHCVKKLSTSLWFTLYTQFHASDKSGQLYHSPM